MEKLGHCQVTIQSSGSAYYQATARIQGSGSLGRGSQWRSSFLGTEQESKGGKQIVEDSRQSTLIIITTTIILVIIMDI